MTIDELAAARASAFEGDADPVYGDLGTFVCGQATDFSPTIDCPSCPRAPRLLTRRFEAFFAGEHLPCPTCGQPIDLWRVLTASPADGTVATIVGCRTTMINLQSLSPGLSTIDLTDHAVPAAATIAKLTYDASPSSQAVSAWFDDHRIPERYPGGGTITETFGDEPWVGFDARLHVAASSNSATLSVRDEVPRLLTFLHDRTSSNGVATDVKLAVTWFDTSRVTEEWVTLFNAYVMLFGGQSGPAVVLANTAVEARLYQLLSDLLNPRLGATTAKEFLDELGHGYRLRAVLPLVQQMTGLPKLPDDVAGALNRLRRRRNDVAHMDDAAKRPEVDEACWLLIASAFGLHYLGYVRRLMSRAP